MQAQGEDRSIGFPGSEVTGGCELPDMGAGTLTGPPAELSLQPPFQILGLLELGQG